mgnify:CR=1 FL=1|tara:strand:+ start:165 stop:419 length:255 start_codon:yes stop_codon:yes gene_type:complete
MRKFLIIFANDSNQVEVEYWFLSEPQHGLTPDNFTSMIQSCLGIKISNCSADARQFIQENLFMDADTVEGDGSDDYTVYSVEEL